ncbi:helix-turn-helix transcriptional regulator [Microlunatus soli]|uniref:AraC-type DNA-binding protein n=1 Tax=Microlunatus soli TaxID=630515 RepID=A0A1H1UVK6_9ACTN|nr:helix-turn-helix transcriptional regulator [Microlunatus soli]SDS76562.1 AraC-type DNA-binding protein [Microlunatus soli]
MSLSIRSVGEPVGPLARIWTAECTAATEFSSIAAVITGIGCVRVDGVTTVHLRGPATRAVRLSCPAGAEYFGADLSIGSYLTVAPPAGLTEHRDTVLPTNVDGRLLLGGEEWEIPTPDTMDVFVERLVRAGLIACDPTVPELLAGVRVRIPARTAQHRFHRAVGISQRTLQVIERTRQAASLLSRGVPIIDTVAITGFYDQPQLTRVMGRLIGHTPAEVAAGGVFLDL